MAKLASAASACARTAWTFVALAGVLGAFASSASASAATAVKKVTYRGYTIRVPVTWPVYRLGAGSTACVRFNRHAVYLGAPEHAPALPRVHVIGRTEAILVAPQSTAPVRRCRAAGSETRRTPRRPQRARHRDRDLEPRSRP